MLKKLLIVTIFFSSLVAAGDNLEYFTAQAGRRQSLEIPVIKNSKPGDIIFKTADGEEVMRFKSGGVVIANPKLKPDAAARLVLSAMYQLAPRYFCRNPDDPNMKSNK